MLNVNVYLPTLARSQHPRWRLLILQYEVSVTAPETFPGETETRSETLIAETETSPRHFLVPGVDHSRP